MAKGPKSEWVWFECTECGERNYRTPIRSGQAMGQTKLQLKKFCPRERKHTVHRVRRK